MSLIVSTKSSKYLSYDIFSSTLLSETDLMDWLKIKWERGSGFFNIDKKFDIDCKLVDKVTRNLRNTEIDLSFIHSCRIN